MQVWNIVGNGKDALLRNGHIFSIGTVPARTDEAVLLAERVVACFAIRAFHARDEGNARNTRADKRLVSMRADSDHIARELMPEDQRECMHSSVQIARYIRPAYPTISDMHEHFPIGWLRRFHLLADEGARGFEHGSFHVELLVLEVIPMEKPFE